MEWGIGAACCLPQGLKLGIGLFQIAINVSTMGEIIGDGTIDLL
jgi:hypothetical protein